MSRPLRARGLKQSLINTVKQIDTSRPLRARGLKHYWQWHKVLITIVAPPAGAWIETVNCG